jgi:hypothetical protein
MAEHQHSTSSDAHQHRDAMTATAGLAFHGRIAGWGDGLRMIAVTTERLCTADGPAETTGYLPTVPADSAERILD